MKHQLYQSHILQGYSISIGYIYYKSLRMLKLLNKLFNNSHVRVLLKVNFFKKVDRDYLSLVEALALFMAGLP